MEKVIVSSKFQVVIPKEIRGPLGVEPGQQFQVLRYDDRIELIPLKKMKQMRGFLKGMDTTIERDEDRE